MLIFVYGPTLAKSSSSQQTMFKGLQNRFDAFSCGEFPTVATLFAPDPSKKSSRTALSARAAPPAVSAKCRPCKHLLAVYQAVVGQRISIV